jgi:2-haloacid dehalogenase
METLLDLKAMDPPFAETFGEAAARREWFAQLLQLAFVSTIIGDSRDFGTLGAALEMLVAKLGLSLERAR